MRRVRITTGLVLVFLLGIGLYMSSQKPLWNDEQYSLLNSTLKTSYWSIVTGFVPEGNNSPLFYLLQKAQCDLFSYHPPQEWVIGHWEGVYVFDQVFLRVLPVIFMSMALSALFYYFSRRNSLLVGVYALAVAMTSSQLWSHWAEARPYAGWFALSLFQLLLLLKILEDPVRKEQKDLGCLVLVHCLLSWISTISVIQIMAAGAIIGIFYRPKLMMFIPLILIPMGFCLFYYLRAPQYSFFFLQGPVALINANIPKDRLFIIFISAGILFFQFKGKDWKSLLEVKILLFLLLMLGAFALLLFKFKCGQSQGHQGFEIANRYFLSLTPIGIVGTIFFSLYLLRAFPSKLWKMMTMVVLAAFLAFRFHKAFPKWLSQPVKQLQIKPLDRKGF